MAQKNDKIVGAVFGAGFMGKTHLKGYSRLDHAEICAVIEPSKDRISQVGKEFGIPVYSSLDEAFLNHSFDFIDICIPTPFHLEAIEKSLANECHILVEKPLAAKEHDLDRIYSLMKKSNRRIMTAQVCRFIPAYIMAKSVIESGRLGKPLVFSARRYSELPDWSIGNWINDKEKSGGTIVDLSIHDIDVANWLLGVPLRLNAIETTSKPGGPAHVLESIEYEDSSIANIEASHLLAEKYGLTSEFKLVLEKGFLEYSGNAPAAELKEFSSGLWRNISLEGLASWDDPYTEEIDHFTRCLIDGSNFRISLDEAILAAKSALLLKESVETKNRVLF